MSGHELSSIRGVEDKHLRALARHGVTDLRGLAEADPEAIYRATANLRPRPPRGLIARWQDDAGQLLAATGPDAPGPDAGERDAGAWQSEASFVVVFSQRRTGETWERRVEAERTEVEPERNPQAWPGWEARAVCDWMLSQLGPASGGEPTEADDGAETTEATVVGAGTVGARTPRAEAAAERPALRIDGATFTDAAGPVNVPAAGRPGDRDGDRAGDRPARALVRPARVEFRVSGARPETRLQAVARVLRRDGPGWNAADPRVVPASGQVEFDLADVPAGEHDVALIAWASDAAARPVSVRIQGITIRAG